MDDLVWESGVVGHHRFRLVDSENNRILENTLEIHVLELPRYNIEEIDLATATDVERWLFWFRHAHEYDVATLRKLFPEEAFQQAITIIETIAMKTEDKQMYDTRENAARDHQWLINGARNEGREEGTLIGTIQTCQSILKMPESSKEELLTKSSATRMTSCTASHGRSVESVHCTVMILDPCHPPFWDHHIGLAFAVRNP